MMINFGTPATKGGNGGGIAGLVQGMQMAKQESLADDKNKMLQDQLEMTKKNFEFADLQRRGDKLNTLVWSAEKSGNYDAVNDFLGDKANASFGGGSINVLNDSQVPRGPDGKLLNSFVNRFRENTNTDYDANKPLMTYTSRDEGTRFFTPDTFAAGSGYGKYRRDAQQAEDLLEASITKKLAPTGSDGTDKARWLAENLDIERMMDEDPENVTPDDYRRYRANSNQLGTLKSNANRTLSSKIYAKEMGIIRDGKPLKNITDQKIAEMKLTEADAGNTYNDTATKIGLNTSTIGSLNKLRNELIDYKAGDIAGGTVENALVEASKYLSSEKFKAMSEPEQRKALQTIKMQSGIGMATAQILQAMSGATVSEEEYARTMQNLVGGDIKNINLDSIINAIEGASGVMYDGTKGNIINISDYEYPGTKAEYAKKLDKAWNPKNYELTSTGDKKLEDVPAEIIEEKKTKLWETLDKVFGDDDEGATNNSSNSSAEGLPTMDDVTKAKKATQLFNTKISMSKTPIDDLLKKLGTQEKVEAYIKKHMGTLGKKVVDDYNKKYYPNGAE